MPFLVRVQKKDLRGLDTRESTGSGGMLGSGGMVESCRAEDVGKYINVVVKNHLKYGEVAVESRANVVLCLLARARC